MWHTPLSEHKDCKKKQSEHQKQKSSAIQEFHKAIKVVDRDQRLAKYFKVMLDLPAEAARIIDEYIRLDLCLKCQKFAPKLWLVYGSFGDFTFHSDHMTYTEYTRIYDREGAWDEAYTYECDAVEIAYKMHHLNSNTIHMDGGIGDGAWIITHIEENDKVVPTEDYESHTGR